MKRRIIAAHSRLWADIKKSVSLDISFKEKVRGIGYTRKEEINKKRERGREKRFGVDDGNRSEGLMEKRKGGLKLW